MWYSQFIKTSLRKHNLRVDFRVYLDNEENLRTTSEYESIIKSLLSTAIIKGLDIIAVVSRFGIELGNLAQSQAKKMNVDLKVLPGQDYVSAEGVKAIFFNISKNIKPGLPIQEAMKECKSQNGKTMIYDLSKSVAKSTASWAIKPDIVEIYNAHSKAYKDLDIDFRRVISSAARSASELQRIPVYTEIPRKALEDLGFLSEAEGSDFIPKYLDNTAGETQNA